MNIIRIAAGLLVLSACAGQPYTWATTDESTEDDPAVWPAGSSGTGTGTLTGSSGETPSESASGLVTAVGSEGDSTLPTSESGDLSTTEDPSVGSASDTKDLQETDIETEGSSESESTSSGTEDSGDATGCDMVQFPECRLWLVAARDMYYGPNCASNELLLPAPRDGMRAGYLVCERAPGVWDDPWQVVAAWRVISRYVGDVFRLDEHGECRAVTVSTDKPFVYYLDHNVLTQDEIAGLNPRGCWM